MKVFVLFAVIIIFVSDVGSSPKVEENNPLTRKLFYYYAHIQIFFSWKRLSHEATECGGSIIANNWILTSAECFPSQFSGLKVLINNTSPYDGMEVKTKNVIRHSLLAVALVETVTMPFSRDIESIKLPNELFYRSKVKSIRIFIAGMRIEKSSIFERMGLQETDIEIIRDRNICPDAKIIVFFCGATEIVYRGIGKLGSPLIMITDQGFPIQIGMLSRNDNHQNPVVFLRTDALMSWIKQKTGIDFNKK